SSTPPRPARPRPDSSRRSRPEAPRPHPGQGAPAVNERLSKRSIRSFVLRQGRVSNAQRRAVDELLPRYGVPFAARHIDLDAVFGRTAPKILEIGSGMGESTAAIALA